tara:strand:- start:526 stop:759 length:234 start_codon:yes stop_codon:yes gene_type:complete
MKRQNTQYDKKIKVNITFEFDRSDLIEDPEYHVSLQGANSMSAKDLNDQVHSIALTEVADFIVQRFGENVDIPQVTR